MLVYLTFPRFPFGVRARLVWQAGGLLVNKYDLGHLVRDVGHNPYVSHNPFESLILVAGATHAQQPFAGPSYCNAKPCLCVRACVRCAGGLMDNKLIFGAG